MLYNIVMTPAEKYVRLQTGLDIKIVDSCVSTFDEIEDHDAIIAFSQQQGKGRGEHSFFCPKGGIYIVLRVVGMHVDPHTLTPAVGLAVHDTVLSVLGLDTRLKWVNDVIYNGKKVAGILCKSPRKAEYLIGIGINYSTDPAVFDEHGLGEIAGSLCATPARSAEFIAGLLNSVKRAALSPFDFERYGTLCATIGNNVSFKYNGTDIKGFAESIAPDGSLTVRIGTATVSVDAGEVSIIREIKAPVTE